MLCTVGFPEKAVQWVDPRIFEHNVDKL
ncbi:unnamed protein product, partial [Rotaria sp. Silwood1]